MSSEREAADPLLAKYALDITRDGIMITDAETRILEVNRAFVQVTGYTRDEAVGNTPALLKSGRHDATFYQAMWQALREEGYWQGEIWDRRKNGEVYLELLTITAVREPSGQISHYMGVFTDIQKLHTTQQQMERLAHFDALTELPNRNLLAERLREAAGQAVRQNQLLAVIFLDLDGFKQINDRHGHAVGDRLLVMISQRLRQVARSADTVARLGGDEFALMITGLPNMEELELVLGRVLKLASAPCEIDGQPHRLSASLGVTVYPFDSADPDTLLRHADQAMYQAKEAGRNRYHLFDAERDQQAHTRRQLLDRLAEGLMRGELVLYYQPKVNLRTGEVIGAEALVRWQHPERGLLPPGEFLPQVEHHDLIIDIGEWVIRQALAQAQAWHTQGLNLSISVNLAARQLQHPDFLDCLRGCLSEVPGLPPGTIELEILESAALENTGNVRTIIEACQALGVRFALDDFGTGYASLAYLRDIPADVLKIDQSFVRDVLEDPDDLTLVEGVIGLATAFRRVVVAEGVENAEQGVLLLRLGCDLAQGYGIARPMPAERIPAWVRAFRPEPAWALWADTHWEMADFPLLVAQYDHLKWVRQLALFVEGAVSLSLSEAELQDHHSCRFGHWYYGHGRQRYGHLPEFLDLEKVHMAVHELGPEIVRLRRAGDLGAARSRLRGLLALKDDILVMLANLQQAVASHAPGQGNLAGIH
ncbi:MAG TPA: EAL domain-containing protein [Thiobacillaceae bacterium]|nr:EAL domain-containing protein [Thiobacillaceae bacterium]